MAQSVWSGCLFQKLLKFEGLSKLKVSVKKYIQN